MHTCRRAAWIGALALLAPFGAEAAIDPQAIRNVAPEELIITVTASRYEQGPDTSRVYLSARVIEVQRSVSGLKAGDAILVAYFYDHADYKKRKAAHRKQVERGMVGPQFMYLPAVPDLGRHAAFLRLLDDGESTGAVYVPAANQYSFEREGLRERLERIEEGKSP